MLKEERKLYEKENDKFKFIDKLVEKIGRGNFIYSYMEAHKDD